jgi:hypothetical protein
MSAQRKRRRRGALKNTAREIALEEARNGADPETVHRFLLTLRFSLEEINDAEMYVADILGDLPEYSAWAQ